MGSTWKELYRHTVKHQRSTLDLLSRALAAAENSDHTGLKAAIKRSEVTSVYLVCCELDRFEVPSPTSFAVFVPLLSSLQKRPLT